MEPKWLTEIGKLWIDEPCTMTDADGKEWRSYESVHVPDSYIRKLFDGDDGSLVMQLLRRSDLLLAHIRELREALTRMTSAAFDAVDCLDDGRVVFDHDERDAPAALADSSTAAAVLLDRQEPPEIK